MSAVDCQRKIKQVEKSILQLEQQKRDIINKINDLKQQKEKLEYEYYHICLKDTADTSKWLGTNFDWLQKVQDLLINVFKLTEFRSHQLAAINATLSKKDVILVMPTGGGKSLVYQLSSLVTGNLTLVVSPLISLIDDQLMALKRFGISAATLNSTMAKNEKRDAMKKMLANELNVMFVTPELIAKSKLFMNNLTKICKEGKLDRFVIDEVHCCSQWGHDFRPDYQYLSLFKSQFSNVPILGLTATATTDVLIDIKQILDIPQAVIFRAPYNRPNLFYKVVTKGDYEESIRYLKHIITTTHKEKSGIIYATTQKECEDLAMALKGKAVRAAPYHANLESAVKNKIHRKWIKEEYQVIVATVAFGMGIDKPNVRFVIHYSAPKNLEGLYQESGRAGRDGEEAHCILMFNLADWLRHYAMAQNSKEEKAIKNILPYCLDVSTCRRKLISTYFEDSWTQDDCKAMCDHCAGTVTTETYNISSCLRDILKIISTAKDEEINLTLKKLIDSWFQEGLKQIKFTGKKPGFTKQQAEYIVAFLLSKGYLVVERGYSLVKPLAYISATNDEPLDENIVMSYTESIKGVPVYTTSNKSLPENSEQTFNSTTNIDLTNEENESNPPNKMSESTRGTKGTKRSLETGERQEKKRKKIDQKVS